MPKKGKKAKKKGDKAKEGAEVKEEPKDEEDSPAYDKQFALENELNDVNGEIKELKEHISLLQK